jgi:hypothetical protein
MLVGIKTLDLLVLHILATFGTFFGDLHGVQQAAVAEKVPEYTTHPQQCVSWHAVVQQLGPMLAE